MLTTERTPRSWDDRRPATKGLDGVWRAGRPLPARDLIVEADVQRDIKLALSPVCLLDERRAGLVTVESGATFTATTQGAADLHGVLPGGRHIEVECKHPRKRCKFSPAKSNGCSASPNSVASPLSPVTSSTSSRPSPPRATSSRRWRAEPRADWSWSACIHRRGGGYETIASGVATRWGECLRLCARAHRDAGTVGTWHAVVIDPKGDRRWCPVWVELC